MCNARQHSDQMICGPCGLAWDMNDPDPPRCLNKNERRSKVVNVVRKLEGRDKVPVFEAIDLVNDILESSGVTVSETHYRMCIEIARRAYKQGQDDLTK